MGELAVIAYSKAASNKTAPPTAPTPAIVLAAPLLSPVAEVAEPAVSVAVADSEEVAIEAAPVAAAPSFPTIKVVSKFVPLAERLLVAAAMLLD